MAVDVNSEATLKMPGGASVAVPAGAVSGSGELVGSVLASPPASAAGLPVGVAYDFRLTGTQLTGQVTLTLPAPPAPAVEGDPGPDAALMAYYDENVGDWTTVPSTYDAASQTVSAQSPHLSSWRPFRLDFGPVKNAMTTGLKKIFNVEDHAQQPTCPGVDQLEAEGFVVGTDHPDVPILKSCAGVNDGLAQLRIANNRGYALSVEFPDQWTSSVTSADEADKTIAAWVAEKIAAPPHGRKIAIVPPGQAITLTAQGNQNPIATVTIDSNAYLASAFLYGIDTLAMVLGKIPGAKSPSPSALANAAKTLFTSSQCIRQGIDLTHADPSDAAGVADVFVRTYKFAIGCLQDQWAIAYGITGGLAAFLLGAVEWLISGVQQLLQGVVGTVDSIRYFNGIKFSVEGATARGVTSAELQTAPVPSLCEHPAGRLIDGSLPGLGPTDGYVDLQVPPDPVLADLTGDGAGDAAAVVGCSAGGVAWPDTVVLWGPGPTLLGSVDMSSVTPDEHATVSGLDITGRELLVTWSTYSGAGDNMVAWIGRLHWDGTQVQLLEVTDGG
ncbi:hypothetical protein [Modestobacter lapidis]|nr:hypothetical protein [Modestobacter lapidis]